MKRAQVLLLLCVFILLGLLACEHNGVAVSSRTVPQIFVTNLGGEPDTIDPNRASWGGEISVIRQCFDGLLGFNPDLTLKAVAATQIPTVANRGISENGLTYTFKLRNDVTWSDGQRVTAKDYVFSIKRMLSPDLAAEYASFYFDIAGAEAYNRSDTKDAARVAYLKDAVAVKALDDYTLQIKLAQIRPVFTQLMALPPVYPLREDVIARYGDKWTEPPNYIGDGPFILTEWTHQDHLSFGPNPNYWGTKAKLAQMTFKMITDANASLAGYKNNELQLSGVPAGMETAITADPSLSKEVVRINSLTTVGFLFNVTKPPFDNLKVRQALSCAVDRASFVNDVRGGVGRVALSWIPPGMPGYDADLGKEYDFNPAKAKRLMADAGYADVSKLPEIKFQYADTGGSRTTAQFLQGQIKTNLGINMTLEPMESKAFAQLVNSRRQTWCWLGWSADYPDPDNWLPQIFGSGAGSNASLYSNPAFDALAEQGKKELDNARRLQIWAQAQQIVMADAPIVPMMYLERFGLLKRTVQGFSATSMDGPLVGDSSFRNLYVNK